MDIILIWHNDDGDGERQSVVYVQLINFSRTKNFNDDDGDGVRCAGKFSRIVYC